MSSNQRSIMGSIGSVLLATFVLAPVIAAATPAKGETSPAIRWTIRPDGPAPAESSLVQWARVNYEVDVYGGTATGTLTYAFAYGGQGALSVRFETTLPSQVEVLDMALESEGRRDALAVEPVVNSPTPAPAAETRRSGASRPSRIEARSEAPGQWSIRSAPFEIAADSTFEIRTRFRIPLSVERGIFGLTLPPVEQSRSLELGTSPDAPRVVLSRVSTTVHYDAPLQELASSTHEILSDFLGDRTIIEPIVPEFPAGRAFSLTFATGSAKDPTLAGRVRRDGERGHAIEILLDPPRETAKSSSRAKQMLFVVDTSGSMADQDKIDQARRAVERSLDSLQPTDRFNVIEFDDDFKLMRPAPIAPVAAGDYSVKRWLAGLSAEGGTMLLPALAAALDQPDDPERQIIIVVVTDGALADEKPVLELLKERLGDRRLFVVGAGPLVRQGTLLRLAEYGRGGAAFFGDSASLEQAVSDLFASIADPLAWDLKLNWNGGDVVAIEPSRLPDLYAGRPVRVLARVSGDLPSSLAVSVSTVEGERRYRVSLPPID